MIIIKMNATEATFETWSKKDKVGSVVVTNAIGRCGHNYATWIIEEVTINEGGNKTLKCKIAK